MQCLIKISENSAVDILACFLNILISGQLPWILKVKDMQCPIKISENSAVIVADMTFFGNSEFFKVP